MKIFRQSSTQKRQGTALVSVMVLGALLTVVLLIASKRTSALQQELQLLETRQNARLEKAAHSGNTNQLQHGQSARH